MIANQKRVRKKQLTTPRQPTAEDNLGLARLAARPFAKGKAEPLEDTDQYADACLGLVKAEADFDPGKGLLSSWFFGKARKEMVDGHRERHSIPTMRLDDVDQELLEAIPQEERPDPAGLLEVLLAPQPDDRDIDRRNRQMAVDHFLHGKSMTDIARDNELSKMAVSLAIRSAILKIRQRHEELIAEYQ